MTGSESTTLTTDGAATETELSLAPTVTAAAAEDSLACRACLEEEEGFEGN